MDPSPKHSGLGIASFVISIAVMIFVLLGFVLVIASDLNELAVNNEKFMSGEQLLGDAPLVAVGGLLFVLAALAAFVGGVLGIIGLVQRNRKKVFAILGTIFNWLIVMFVVFLLMIGIFVAV